MTQAVALWGCKIQPGKRISAHDSEDSVGSFRLTMAAIDSSDKSNKPSTIKVIRRPRLYNDNDNNINDSGEISESDLKELEVEYVLCTLKHGEQYQQCLDLTFSEDEEVFFTTSGDCPVYLTGNYVILDLDDDYDISSDEELFDKYSDGSDANGSESDELDDSPKIEELSSSESKASDLEKKRSLSDDDFDNLDDAMEQDTNEHPNLKKRLQDSGDIDISKLSKKQKKKMKFNAQKLAHKEEKSKSNVSLKKDDVENRNFQDHSKKSASFPKDVDLDSGTPKFRMLEGGVKIEDKVIGNGPQVKNGSKVGVRYIGKLVNGKQFDSNTKGQPFSFCVGKGEVIKGWDIGIKGMALGGQRRITIPSHMAYGKKQLSGIPANSDLVFDVKLVKLS